MKLFLLADIIVFVFYFCQLTWYICNAVTHKFLIVAAKQSYSFAAVNKLFGLVFYYVTLMRIGTHVYIPARLNYASVLYAFIFTL